MAINDGHQPVRKSGNQQSAIRIHLEENKAGYAAQDAPSTRLREGVPDLRTDGRTHPLIEMRQRI